MSVEWFKNAIIYHIIIDRFAGFKSKEWNKPEFMGGTIKGIIEKLPYLKELGINTIWISPFYKTSAYHGYHITNFYEVDPHFGTLNDIKELIIKVHKLKMKIITGFVPNHCSHKHPFFSEAQKDKNSEYYNWFFFKKWPDDYMCFLSYKEIPKINLDYLPARDHIVGVAKYWLSLGFDGFRLDHVIGPTHKFWKHFKKEIKKDFPNAVLIGEAWMMGIKWKELRTINVKNKYLKWLLGTSSDGLLKEYKGELDGVLDFKFQELVRVMIAKQGVPQTKKLLQKLKKHFAKYPDNYFLPTFLDNHDMNRFLYEYNNDKEKLKQAARIQYSTNQPIIIYYGTEVGVTQHKSIQEIGANGDLQARQPMKWENQDNELLEFYKELNKKRNLRKVYISN
ncbi:hypothetical protein AYK26_04965 [Euryarchaeota archaeon SM23-78]|nr:MAG: hypothetical protein AYK26_04965 [Euryarchaeota archaeon SM23-78]MBW3000920.1 hypothetical protein [Candidatus Woesearchaeota archaeon]